MGIRAVGLCAVLLVAACGEDGDDDAAATTTTTTVADGCELEGASSEAAATTVEVTLAEYTITAVPDAVPAGPTGLAVANTGLTFHELAVVRYDGDPAAFPLNPVGGVDEAQLPPGAVVGRFRPLAGNVSCQGTLDLDPGRYVLLCNLVDDGSSAHYARRMYSVFTVG